MVRLHSRSQTSHLIYPNLEQKLPKKSKSSSSDLPNSNLRHLAFVELKKANEQIALIQYLKVSFTQIQEELGELEKLNTKVLHGDIKEGLSKEKFFQQIKQLQNKLIPLLKQAKSISTPHSPLNFSLDDSKNLQKGLAQIQDNLSIKLEEVTKELEKFFQDKKEVLFQKDKLQHLKFISAHNPELFSSLSQALL